jgi:hypothetical protein
VILRHFRAFSCSQELSTTTHLPVRQTVSKFKGKEDYAGPDEFQFNKTVIPVRLAQYENEKLVSRSQAKRLLARIERFKHVIFDFAGVFAIGQAFADEIFRVYARNHPDIVLLSVKMEPNVEKMVNRAMSSREAKEIS